METATAKVVKRLEIDGWTLLRHGANHDVYTHPARPLPIQVPRHRTLSPGVPGPSPRRPDGTSPDPETTERSLEMHRYIALIDGEAGAYGVSFPDLPGCVAMAPTIDEAVLQAADALREFDADVTARGASMPPPTAAERLREAPDVAAALREGATLVSVPLVRETARSVKANLSINAGVLAALDAEASRRGLTRSALVEAMARRLLASDV